MLSHVPRFSTLEEKLSIQWKNLLRVQNEETIVPFCSSLLDWNAEGTVYVHGGYSSEFHRDNTEGMSYTCGRRLNVEYEQGKSHYFMDTHSRINNSRIFIRLLLGRSVWQHQYINMTYLDGEVKLDIRSRDKSFMRRSPLGSYGVKYKINESDVIPVLIYSKYMLLQEIEDFTPSLPLPQL